MKKILLLVGLVVMLVGHQTIQPEHSFALDNTTFMTLWSTFKHCQSSTDLDSLRVDAQRLNQAAHAPTDGKGFILPLPKQIERLVAKPVPRLAADLTAMAAACTLYTGQAALNAGRFDVATEMFRSIMESHPQAEYAYYVEQARLGLTQVGVGPVAVTPALSPIIAD